MPKRAILVSLDDRETPRALAPGRVRHFYLLFLPAILSFLFCGFGGWLVSSEEDLAAFGVVLIIAGVLLGAAYLIFDMWFIGILPARTKL